MELYRLLVEQAPNAIAMFDLQMRYVNTSRQWLRDYGLADRNIIGCSHYEIFPEIGENWKTIHLRCLAGETHTCDAAPFIRLDGSLQWIRWEIRPWYTNEGKIGGIIMYTADITPKKILEEALEVERRQFQSIFETSSIGIALVGLNGRWLKVNKSLQHLLGYSEQELMHLTFQDLTHPDDLSADLHLVQHLLNGRLPHYQMEKRYFHKNGSTIWALLTVALVWDNNNMPAHFVSQIIDISSSKRLARLQMNDIDKHSAQLARELHENVAQTLASIKFLLEPGDQHKNIPLSSIHQQLTSLIHDIQELSNQIVPTTFDQENIFTLIETFILHHSIEHQLQITVELDEGLKTMPVQMYYHVFKIVEGLVRLMPVRKQSAGSLCIFLSDHLYIEYIIAGDDNSMPISPVEELIRANIKTRVEMMDGFSQMPVVNDKGLLYKIALPIPAESARIF